MRTEWEPIPPIKTAAGFLPAISKGYEELAFPEQAMDNYEAAARRGKDIAEWRNLPWWRRWITARPA